MFYELIVPTWGDEEKRALEEVIDSGFFTMGRRVAAFEEAFARYHGRKHAVMVNSGSSANLLAVAAPFFRKDKPLERGDEIIVPAIGWATTYMPLQQYGLKLRFVDVERDTLNLDVARLEEALTPRTRAIATVSILGNPVELDRVRDFADAHDLYFFEDNCESLDAELNGRKTGTFGDVATFSFFFSHHISTMEGGMVLTDDTELAHLAHALRSHGWARGLPEDSPIHTPGPDPHYEDYRFLFPGYNVRPLELSAAAGLVQLEKLPEMTAMRRKNLETFQGLFAGDDRFLLQREVGRSSAFALTLILAPNVATPRDTVYAALREADIGFRMITGGCFPRHDVIRFFDHDIVGTLENADLAHDRGFFVGNHPYDLKPQLERLREVLDAVVR